MPILNDVVQPCETAFDRYGLDECSVHIASYYYRISL